MSFTVTFCLSLEYVQNSFLFAIVVGPRLSPTSLHVVSWSFYQRHALQNSPLFHVDTPDCCICLVVQQALRERCQSVRCGRDIVQTHRSNQWLFVISTFQIVFPSNLKYSQKVLSFFLVAARSASLLFDDAVATIEIHACNLSNLDEMHERKAS